MSKPEKKSVNESKQTISVNESVELLHNDKYQKIDAIIDD